LFLISGVVFTGKVPCVRYRSTTLLTQLREKERGRREEDGTKRILAHRTGHARLYLFDIVVDLIFPCCQPIVVRCPVSENPVKSFGTRSSSMQRKYTEKQKQRAVAMMRAPRWKIGEVSWCLKIPTGTLRRWLDKANIENPQAAPKPYVSPHGRCVTLFKDGQPTGAQWQRWKAAKHAKSEA
jgi:hypothetical protein